jgi:hypothetical protein
MDEKKTLSEAEFQIGEFLDIAIITSENSNQGHNSVLNRLGGSNASHQHQNGHNRSNRNNYSHSGGSGGGGGGGGVQRSGRGGGRGYQDRR